VICHWQLGQLIGNPPDPSKRQYP